MLHCVLDDGICEKAKVASRVHDFLDVDSVLEFVRDLAMAIEGVEEVGRRPVVFPFSNLAPSAPAQIRVLNAEVNVVFGENGALVVDGPKLLDVPIYPA